MTFYDFIDFLQSTNDIAVAIRLIMATVFGGLVGWERIVTHHNAGIKTFALVSLGSAVATVLNIYLALLPDLAADVSRIPAGVVSGIGFLGAGTILVTGKKQIKGLSTAATLWVTSCMGMAIGGGYLVVGVCAFLLIAFANVILLQISDRVENNSKYMSIYIEVPKNRGVNKLTNAINEQGFTIMSMEKSKEKTLQSSDAGLIIDIALDRKRSHHELISMFNNLEYVNYVEEV
ncbi:MgtC/SapB family protein [Butyrivibrio sp. CB08]|uniref:MgtC/SapB family protein n=1 Tax=Butyrivibrio sp. CB08 TaxID=2364879 RepID=UPI000EAA14ED|nr:MgtC/SapB family protein [Butyrivibrio sp. CB08]RKM60463.1 MgtC/SapB family protein [Butyrivibrio sp. CB08]